MKISTRGRYALRILMDLAKFIGDEKPRMISDICKSQGLSRKYVGRLIIPLCRAGWVESKRGAKGGYFMRCDPDKLTLLEVIEVMEGKVSVAPCLACVRKCKREKICTARVTWDIINQRIREDLSKITLREIINHHGEHEGMCLR